MNALQVEEEILRANQALSKVIAKSMVERIQYGEVVVVCKQPKNLLKLVHKAWLAEIRYYQRERAMTLDAKKIMQYTEQISLMQHARFSTKLPDEGLFATVLFCRAEALLEFAPVCSSMYVAAPVDKEVLYRISGFMPDHGLVTVYKRRYQ